MNIRELLNFEKNIYERDAGRIRQGLLKFKMDLLKLYPFYGDIVMRIPVIEDETVASAQTDGRSIRYNPRFLKKMNEGQRNYVLMHEVFHVLFLHWKRVAGRDQRLWNVACDLVVNGTIDNIHWKTYGKKDIEIERPPEGCFYPGRYMGDPVEEIYARLLEENKGGGGGGTIRFNGKPVYVRPDLKEPEALTPEEIQVIEAQIKTMVNDAIKKRGLGASYMIPAQLLKITQTRKLPWHKLLFEFLSMRETDESSYYTPERKYIHMGMVVPGTARSEDELGEIWAFVDSSGSIGSNELKQFMTQLYRIAKEFHCIFHIAFWDTKVTDVYKNVTDREKILKCAPRHSGGTDINCVYRYIREEKLKPAVMIILTDGYFGEVTENVGSLRKKTILVVSEDGARFDNNNKVGRLAQL
ncbi:MAG: hypothetical protein IKN24_06650 [Lachnospiraceae bacterium]|nr:hypothetical protein [Lachnospiraceae bacterium]